MYSPEALGTRLPAPPLLLLPDEAAATADVLGQQAAAVVDPAAEAQRDAHDTWLAARSAELHRRLMAGPWAEGTGKQRGAARGDKKVRLRPSA